MTEMVVPYIVQGLPLDLINKKDSNNSLYRIRYDLLLFSLSGMI